MLVLWKGNKKMTGKKYYYVYKITDKKRNKFYIGSRSSKIPPEQDLGKIYFSSSENKKFIKEQIEKSDQFIYEVIKIFPDYEQASDYEIELLKQENATSDKNYYNRKISKSKFIKPESNVTKNTVKYLGNLIGIARKERGYTQQELAERTGISRMTVVRIESGSTKVAIGTVFEVCFLLGIPLLGCDEKYINNLTRMLSYMNKFIPERISNKFVVDDDF